MAITNDNITLLLYFYTLTTFYSKGPIKRPDKITLLLYLYTLVRVIITILVNYSISLIPKHFDKIVTCIYATSRAYWREIYSSCICNQWCWPQRHHKIAILIMPNHNIKFQCHTILPSSSVQIESSVFSKFIFIHIFL